MCDSGKSPDVSICHTVSNMASLSICQLHDLSVCQPKHDSIWISVHLSVLHHHFCLSNPGFGNQFIFGYEVEVELPIQLGNGNEVEYE